MELRFHVGSLKNRCGIFSKNNRPNRIIVLF